jgi:hypothetical protein
MYMYEFGHRLGTTHPTWSDPVVKTTETDCVQIVCRTHKPCSIHAKKTGIAVAVMSCLFMRAKQVQATGVAERMKMLQLLSATAVISLLGMCSKETWGNKVLQRDKDEATVVMIYLSS